MDLPAYRLGHHWAYSILLFRNRRFLIHAWLGTDNHEDSALCRQVKRL